MHTVDTQLRFLVDLQCNFKSFLCVHEDQYIYLLMLASTPNVAGIHQMLTLTNVDIISFRP